VETFKLGLWRVLTSCVRVRQASEELSPSRELHWLWWSRPLDLAMADGLTVMTRSRIFEMVLRRTILRKEVGESQEAFPVLSSTTPFPVFSEGRVVAECQ